jgi:kynurenine formamidase
MKDPPRYRDLPLDQSMPPRSAWGLWGKDDELGTLNLLGTEQVQRGMQSVRSHKVFSLNWKLEEPNPPFYGRGAIQHHPFPNEVGFDDCYDSFYPQSSTQWDALGHVEHPEYGFYNGRKREDMAAANGARNGMHNYARKGIVGRGVLLDVARYLASQGQPIDGSQRRDFTVADLEATRQAAGITYETGDILVIRSGWMNWYESADAQTRATLADDSINLLKTPGISGGEDMAEYLWDSHVAAVASDCPAVEAWPHELKVDSYLHFRLIPLLGMALGEMWYLEQLADECAKDRCYSFMLVSAPLNKFGGVGSLANVLAIK